jgi:hypothetical protein
VRKALSYTPAGIWTWRTWPFGALMRTVCPGPTPGGHCTAGIALGESVLQPGDLANSVALEPGAGVLEPKLNSLEPKTLSSGSLGHGVWALGY